MILKARGFVIDAFVSPPSGTESVSAEGRESAPQHGSAPEIGLLAGNARPDGHAGLCLATQCSSPSSPWMGRDLIIGCERLLEQLEQLFFMCGVLVFGRPIEQLFTKRKFN